MDATSNTSHAIDNIRHPAKGPSPVQEGMERARASLDRTTEKAAKSSPYSQAIERVRQDWAEQARVRIRRERGPNIRAAMRPAASAERYLADEAERAARQACTDADQVVRRAHPTPNLAPQSNDHAIRKEAERIANTRSLMGWWQAVQTRDHWNAALAAMHLDAPQIPMPPGQTRWAQARRAADKHWWRRQLRRTVRRGRGEIDVALGLINRYVSPFMVADRRDQEQHSHDVLSQLVAWRESDGATIPLADIAASSRQGMINEMKVRAFGMAEAARQESLDPFLVTITCPSRMHPGSPKYDGTTPRQAADWLTGQWRRWMNREGRSTKARAPLRAYGVRAVEPHRDGCPHMHAVVWADDAARLGEQLEAYFRLVEPEQGDHHRVQIDEPDFGHAGAVGYAIKYAMKSASSEEGLGGLSEETYQEPGERHDHAGVAFRAWRSAWGIRTFAAFAVHRKTPSVQAWRELRRADPTARNYQGMVPNPDHPLYEHWRAAQDGDWARYMGACEQIPIQLYRGAGRYNKYDEMVDGPVIGVGVRSSGEGAILPVITRVETWQIMKGEDKKEKPDKKMEGENLTELAGSGNVADTEKEPRESWCLNLGLSEGEKRDYLEPFVGSSRIRAAPA